MDIVITLPKSIKWEQYEKELNAVKDGKSVLNFKVPHIPKNTSIGERCYLCYNGYVIGWMEIVGLKENNFVCSVTGMHWEGNFVQRSGAFHRIEPFPMKGFQGFRYLK
tara:strand:- start:1230 stop:1553 length:324 start_codon:yes stop_codon:yes gene_type:complete